MIKRVFLRFKKWYLERKIRQIFVIMAGLAFLLLFLAQFDPTGFLFYAVIGCALIALFAAIGDSWQSLQDFEKAIKEMEKKHKLREIESFGTVVTPCFEYQDRKDIKRKRLNYFGIIGLKLIFLVILIALLIQGGL